MINFITISILDFGVTSHNVIDQFSSGLDEGETHAFPLNDIRKNQAKMDFSTPFSQENICKCIK
jgi:hypothetical protein